MSGGIIADLIAEGVSPELIERVADALADARASVRALESRRKSDRDRKAKSRHVTGSHVTGRDSRDAGSPYEDTSTPSGTDLPVEASASTPLRQPVAEAFAVWGENARAAGWSVPVLLSPDRSRLLSARLRQHGIEGWKAAIARARASPYLAGADPPSWFTFDWLCKAKNFLKVIEGNYDRNRSHQQPASGWQTAHAAVSRPG